MVAIVSNLFYKVLNLYFNNNKIKLLILKNHKNKIKNKLN